MSTLDKRSYALRRAIVDAVIAADMGHIGPAMSIVEILRVLYDSVLQLRADQPDWPLRDRLILSKGHGCLALYALLADKGFFHRNEMMRFCKAESMLGGHPESLKIPGVEASTGSLGHGLSIGVGMAMAARLKGLAYRTFVLTGDGELNEGSIWEAALHAAKHKLERLTVIVDRNDLQCYGPTESVVNMRPLADKWRSFGFRTFVVDGHDVQALEQVFATAPASAMPTAIICETVKGKGLYPAEGNPGWHHRAGLDKKEIAMMCNALGRDGHAQGVL